MTNLRETYRHQFAQEDMPRAGFCLPAHKSTAFSGAIYNLSLGGMGVIFEDPAPEIAIDDRFKATLHLSTDAEPYSFDCAVIHCDDITDPPFHGFRFLPLLDANAEAEREKQLWRYLLEQQRRLLQEKRRNKSQSPI